MNDTTIPSIENIIESIDQLCLSINNLNDILEKVSYHLCQIREKIGDVPDYRLTKGILKKYFIQE